MTDDQILSNARAALQREAASVAGAADQLGEPFVAAARMLLACEGHVLVAGSGTSHATALRFAHLLSCCGTPALFIHPGDAQHGTSGAVTPRDVLFVISKGGETIEVNALAGIAKKRGAKVIALTEKPGSTAAQLSDVVVCITPDPGADLLGMIATGSALTYAAVCDALCEVLYPLRGYTRDQFEQTHPGGAVGKGIRERRG